MTLADKDKRAAINQKSSATLDAVKKHKGMFHKNQARCSHASMLSLLLGLAFSAVPVAAQHGMDIVKHNEHVAALNLVPTTPGPSGPTDIARASGNWADASTWTNGVPGPGAQVEIPLGTVVTYNVNDTALTAPLHWLRVDGTLAFSTTHTTRMNVDTIVIAPGGTWQEGTAARPIPAAITATVFFTDSGPINTTWDPTELSRGLISHGIAGIYGASKTTFVQAAPARVGASTLTVSPAPSGWRAGDIVVLSGAHFIRDDFGRFYFQDEQFTVLSVRGPVVTLSGSLKYDHVAPAARDTQGHAMACYLTNFSRSVIFRSQQTSLSDNSLIQRRGHVMFMHSANVHVHEAGFYDLGRTNKSLLVDDPGPMYEYPGQGANPANPKGGNVYAQGTGTNPRGRYSLHFHLCGSPDVNTTDGTGPVGPTTLQVDCIGCAVMGSPGWGIDNHDSNCLIQGCATYNVQGSGFVEESGNGIGRFDHCISIHNPMAPGWNQYGDWRNDLHLLDLGHNGFGFFYRGNAMDTRNCVAVSCQEAGYAWDGKHGEGGSNISPAALHFPASSNDTATLAWASAPVALFDGCTAAASTAGIYEYYSLPVADDWSQLTNTTTWNCRTGILNAYGWQMIERNAVLIGDPALSGSIGVNTTHQFYHDIFLENVRAAGFTTGVQTDYDTAFNSKTKGDVRVVNCDFSQNAAPFKDPASRISYVATAGHDPHALSWAYDTDKTQTSILPGGWFRTYGTETDPFGSCYVGSDNPTRDGSFAGFTRAASDVQALVSQGYYEDAKGAYLVFPFAIQNRFTGEVNTYYPKGYLDQYPNWLSVGPDLGTFIDPGTKAVAAPQFAGAVGTGKMGATAYVGPQPISLVSGTTGATIYYTTDNSTPSRAGTSNIYNGPIRVAHTTTLKAIAYSGDMQPSTVSTATVTINPARASGTPVYQINCGGDTPFGPFVREALFSGGNYYGSGTDSINTATATHPAPIDIYRTCRFSDAGQSFSYSFPELIAGASYTVRLHFADFIGTDFNVSINGAQVLTDMNVSNASGGERKALSQEYAAVADSAGKITITFTAVTKHAEVNGIEILTTAGHSVMKSHPQQAAGSLKDSGVTLCH